MDGHDAKVTCEFQWDLGHVSRVSLGRVCSCLHVTSLGLVSN